MRGPSFGQLFLRRRVRRTRELQPRQKCVAETQEPSARSSNRCKQPAPPHPPTPTRAPALKLTFCGVPNTDDCEYLLINFPLAEF